MEQTPRPKNSELSVTCRCSAQNHWMNPGNANVPDSIAVADVLFDLLAQTLGHRTGSQAGYNLAGKIQG